MSKNKSKKTPKNTFDKMRDNAKLLWNAAQDARKNRSKNYHDFVNNVNEK